MYAEEDLFINTPISVETGAPLSIVLGGSDIRVNYSKPYPFGPTIEKEGQSPNNTQIECKGCPSYLAIAGGIGQKFKARPLINLHKNSSISWFTPVNSIGASFFLQSNLKVADLYTWKVENPTINGMYLLKSNSFGYYHRVVIEQSKLLHCEVYLPDKGLKGRVATSAIYHFGNVLLKAIPPLAVPVLIGSDNANVNNPYETVFNPLGVNSFGPEICLEIIETSKMLPGIRAKITTMGNRVI